MSEIYGHEPTPTGHVILHTSFGSILVSLFCRETPKACQNFLTLATLGYYDGCEFFRLIKDLIAQTGDATNTGLFNELIYNEPYPLELHPRLKFRYRGLLGIANKGKGTNSNGSQFFITFQRADHLNGVYTLFGRIEGNDIYKFIEINGLAVDKDDRPLFPPIIHTIEVVQNPFAGKKPERIPPIIIDRQAAEIERESRITIPETVAPQNLKPIVSFHESDDECPVKIVSAHHALGIQNLVPSSAQTVDETANTNENRHQPCTAQKMITDPIQDRIQRLKQAVAEQVCNENTNGEFETQKDLTTIHKNLSENLYNSFDKSENNLKSGATMNAKERAKHSLDLLGQFTQRLRMKKQNAIIVEEPAKPTDNISQDEYVDEDWMVSSLKFATDSAKAYAMDASRNTIVTYDPLTKEQEAIHLKARRREREAQQR